VRCLVVIDSNRFRKLPIFYLPTGDTTKSPEEREDDEDDEDDDDEQ
jgi:hypothetical protein